MRMELFINYIPWVWLGLAIILIVIESITFTLTTIWFALGALVMIFVSLTHIALKWQLLIFIVLSLLLLVFTRPFAVKKLKVKKTPMNSDSLEGKKVLVTQKITELEKGAIKINGTEWTASSADGSEIESGTECIIKEIQGATVIVEPIDNKENKNSEGETE